MANVAGITDGLDKPKTAEKITITDLGIKRANPSPIVAADAELLLEEFLSPRKLRALTGMDDLTKVKCLQLKVDSTQTSLGNFGNFVPNLQELKIKDSIVPSIRDLGSSLSNVQILWMPRCSLVEIDGISSLDNLAELFLAYNDVVELNPLTMLEQLRLLDIEGNNVEDLKQIEYLAFCPKLRALTLDGNPVASRETRQHGQRAYRRKIKSIIPHLECLDDVEFKEEMDKTDKAVNAFEDDWNYINTFVLCDTKNAEIDARLNNDSTERHSTASSAAFGSVHTPLPRPSTAYRPGSALKPASADKQMELIAARSSNQSYSQTARPLSSAKMRPHSEDANMLKEAASELTIGDVVCGNPAKSLRSKVRSSKNSSLFTTVPSTTYTKDLQTAAGVNSAANSTVKEAELDEQTRQLFDEASLFKKQHESTRKMIEKERAPQVLTIDLDQDVPPDSNRETLSSEGSSDELEEDEAPSDLSPLPKTQSSDSKLFGKAERSSEKVKDLPKLKSPSALNPLNPLKVPTPPSRNAAAVRNGGRPHIPNGKSKQSLTMSVPTPPPVENPGRVVLRSSVLLPSKSVPSK